MEAKLIAQSKSTLSIVSRRRDAHKPRKSPVLAVLTRPPENNTQVKDMKSVKLAAPNQTSVATREKSTTVYNDNWFDQLAINYLSQSVQAATGLRNSKDGYESLVEAAAAVSRNFNVKQQRQLVIEALQLAFPAPILSLIRILLPPSKLAREYFAAFTTLFFAWLVGPCEVRESEINGRKEKNVVHIKKCRFLEESNCVGMCTNLCKVPSQTFIKDSFGLPINMVPNFDDLSCEMIFGQDPPALDDDPAFKQPCYQLCKTKQKHSAKCSS